MALRTIAQRAHGGCAFCYAKWPCQNAFCIKSIFAQQNGLAREAYRGEEPGSNLNRNKK